MMSFDLLAGEGWCMACAGSEIVAAGAKYTEDIACYDYSSNKCDGEIVMMVSSTDKKALPKDK